MTIVRMTGTAVFMEMFNVFNHANFGLPGGSFGGEGFGIVSSTSTSARQIQVGMRIIF